MCFIVRSKSNRRPNIISAVLVNGACIDRSRKAGECMSSFPWPCSMYVASSRTLNSVERLVGSFVSSYVNCPVLRRAGRGYAGKLMARSHWRGRSSCHESRSWGFLRGVPGPGYSRLSSLCMYSFKYSQRSRRKRGGVKVRTRQ